MTIDEHRKILDSHIGPLLGRDLVAAGNAGAAIEATIHDYTTYNVVVAFLAGHAATWTRFRMLPQLVTGAIIQPDLTHASDHAGRTALQIIAAAANNDLNTSAALITSTADAADTADGADYALTVMRYVASYARAAALAGDRQQ